MPVLSVVTINILSDLSRWEARRPLLASQIGGLKADLIALQEVNLTENTAAWLAEQLGYTHTFITPKTGPGKDQEAIAILSRLPFERQASLDLLTQERVAQYVLVNIGGQLLVVANGHFFWQPGESPERDRQVERLIAWLDAIPDHPPCIICGDFNSTPESRSVEIMRRRFQSAYAAAHGHEPKYTTPTPLPRQKLFLLRTLWQFRTKIKLSDLRLGWKDTLDYIFFDPSLHLLECRLVLNQPDPANRRMYPSDHFGLYAEFEINK